MYGAGGGMMDIGQGMSGYYQQHPQAQTGIFL